VKVKTCKIARNLTRISGFSCQFSGHSEPWQLPTSKFTHTISLLH